MNKVCGFGTSKANGSECPMQSKQRHRTACSQRFVEPLQPPAPDIPVSVSQQSQQSKDENMRTPSLPISTDSESALRTAPGDETISQCMLTSYQKQLRRAKRFGTLSTVDDSSNFETRRKLTMTQTGQKTVITSHASRSGPLQ